MAIKILFAVTVLAVVAFADQARQLNPDVGKSIKQLVPKYGYPFQEHKVTTQDGHILELHRIPHGKANKNIKNKPAVLLLHGLLCSSDAWINMGPETSLGYLLADKGYDVWLGNQRGTTWSRKHKTLDPDADGNKYWDFSYHELGIFDNRAIIDYVLAYTKQDKLFYIGHSQGTTSFFSLAASLPEYNNKIRLMVGLGPVTYTEKLKSPLMYMFLPLKDEIWNYMQDNEMFGILKHNKLITLGAQIFCNDDAPTQFVCSFFLQIFGGFNPSQMNKSKIPVIASSLPSGASWKQFSHFLQGYHSGQFQQYDYGEIENLEQYSQPEPPKYDLDKVTAPVALYYGNNDYLATEENALRTAAALPNVVIKKRVENFNHLDFLWAIDAVPLLYKDILELMENY